MESLDLSKTVVTWDRGYSVSVFHKPRKRDHGFTHGHKKN